MGKDTKKKLVRDHHKASSTPIKKSGKKPVKTEKSEKIEKKSKAEPIPEKVQNAKKPAKESQNHDVNGEEIQKKPGQRHQEPGLDDPTRAFYETLFEQNPESPMAQKYCLEYGLLPEDVAKSLLSKLKPKK